jgi:hypothetical protein
MNEVVLVPKADQPLHTERAGVFSQVWQSFGPTSTGAKAVVEPPFTPSRQDPTKLCSWSLD